MFNKLNKHNSYLSQSSSIRHFFYTPLVISKQIIPLNSYV